MIRGQRDRGAIKRRAEELSTYTQLSRYRNPPDTRRFVIFSRGRSGSTLLISLLDSHPQIHCDAELLRQRRLFPYRYVEGHLRRCRVSAYGFKLLLYHLTCIHRMRDPRAFIEQLIAGGFSILHLERENHFRHALSNIWSQEIGRFHSWAGDPLASTAPVRSDLRRHTPRRLDDIALNAVEVRKAVLESELAEWWDATP